MNKISINSMEVNMLEVLDRSRISRTELRGQWDEIPELWKNILMRHLKLFWAIHLSKHTHSTELIQTLENYSKLNKHQKLLTEISIRVLAKDTEFEKTKIQVNDAIKIVRSSQEKWLLTTSDLFPHLTKDLKIKSINDWIDIFSQLRGISIKNLIVDSIIEDIFFHLSKIDHLDCRYENIKGLVPLKYMKNVRRLNISFTRLHSHNEIGKLKNLEYLSCVDAKVNTLEFTQPLKKLSTVLCGLNRINTLGYLDKHQSLELVNCRSTAVGKKEVKRFKTQQPSCIVKWGFWNKK